VVISEYEYDEVIILIRTSRN